LWGFTPGSGGFRQQIEFNDSFSAWGMKMGGEIFVAGGSNSPQYHVFNTDTDKSRLLLYSGRHVDKSIASRAESVEYEHVNPPFFARDGHFWFGGWDTIIHARKNNLANYENVRDLDIEMSTLFFPDPDGRSVQAVTRQSIWRLTPTE